MANDVQIDKLSIEVGADAQNAAAELDALSAALDRLAKSGRITRIINNLNSLRNQLKGFETINRSISALERLQNVLNGFGNLQNLKSLGSSISAISKLPGIAAQLSGIDFGKLSRNFSDLSKALQALGNVPKLNGLRSIIDALGELPELAGSLNYIDYNSLRENLESISKALSGLNFEKPGGLSGLTKFLNDIPNITQKLDPQTMEAFAAAMDKISAATQPLATEIEKLGTGFSKLPTSVQKVITANQKLVSSSNNVTNSVKKHGNSLVSSIAKWSLFGVSIRTVARYIGQSLNNFNEYVENVNLFSVSMGEYTQQASEFAQRMQDVLGVDAGEAMRNMGLIQNLTTSFGMASDKAYILSKNITQLGYDFSSFYNISSEEAFTKLQAAISGELEPIRRLGIDISTARLQQELFNLGIEANVNELNQADKSMLRYIAIMKQSTNAQTDMARTLNSPANMMRVFNAQVQLLARSIGSLFIPILNAVLPPLIAFIQIIREAISAIAAFFGVEVKFADVTSSVAPSLGGVSDDIDDIGSSAAKSAKEIRMLIGGFDELNVLPEKTGPTSGGGAGGAGGSLLGDIELPEYDMFAGLAESMANKIKEKIKSIGSAIAELFKDFGSYFQPSIDAWAAAWEQIKAKAIEVWPSIQQSVNSLWNDTIVPFGNYMLTDFAPSVANSFSQAFAPIAGDLGAAGLQIFANTLEDVAALSASITNNIIIPALDTVKTIWMDVMLGIQTAWGTYGKPIADALVLAFDRIGTIVSSVYYAMIKPVLMRVIEIVNHVWNTSLKPLWDKVVVMIDQIALTALDFWNNVLSPWINWLVGTFGPQFSMVFDIAASVVEYAVDVIGNALNIGITIINGVLTFLDTLFVSGWSAAWGTVGDSVKNVWESIKKGIKDSINDIIGFVNSMLRAITSGINAVIDRMNSLSITIPNWVPNVGGKSFGINFPKFNAPQIPKLAEGGVLYNPQLVLAGEYANARSNPEIIAPQSMMRETVSEANADGNRQMINLLGQILVAIQESGGDVEVDGETLFRVVKREKEREQRHTGKNPLW